MRKSVSFSIISEEGITVDISGWVLCINTIKIETMADSIITLPLSSNMRKDVADKLQTACLKVRRTLFYDPKLGYNHNMGGVRTSASLGSVTKEVNAITDGFITFHFVSHRRLWFEIEGIDKRYTLHSANEYDFNTKESAATNPYNKIAVAIKKALKERDEMERTYQLLIAA